MKNTFRTLAVGLSILSAAAFCGPTFPFCRITDNSDLNQGVGEAQFSVELINVSDNEVQFMFTNTGPVASSITRIYFDNGPIDTSSLTSITSIDNSSWGVSFSEGATPRNLPAGNTIDFETTSGLSLGADSPVQPNGINPGEYLGVSLAASSYDDVLNDLQTGALRIGLHVQGFADGSSESYVNCGVIPLPSSLLLAAIGLGIVKIANGRRRT